MNKRDLTLAMLAAANGMSYSPVQLQKALFLVMRNLPQVVTEGAGFNFVPYDYGPFDAGVYDEAASLARGGEVVTAPSPYGRFNTYAATPTGIERGRAILAGAAPQVRQYINSVSEWVRSQSFSGLVKSIYDAYPEMRVNSIFQG